MRFWGSKSNTSPPSQDVANGGLQPVNYRDAMAEMRKQGSFPDGLATGANRPDAVKAADGNPDLPAR
jgi:hypothetical protein